MPITQSAKKALRQNKRRRIGNLARQKAFKGAIKQFKKVPTAAALALVYQKLDKAAKAHVIEANKASRLKSRLSKLLKK